MVATASRAATTATVPNKLRLMRARPIFLDLAAVALV